MKILALALVLALVALGIVVVEVIPRLAADRAAGRTTHEGDELALRFGATTETPSTRDPSSATPIPPEGVEGIDYHVVRRGENLSSIALERYGNAGLAGELAKLNGLADPDALQVGQVLRLR